MPTIVVWIFYKILRAGSIVSFHNFLLLLDSHTFFLNNNKQCIILMWTHFFCCEKMPTLKQYIQYFYYQLRLPALEVQHVDTVRPWILTQNSVGFVTKVERSENWKKDLEKSAENLWTFYYIYYILKRGFN